MSRHGLESRITVAAGDFTEQGGIAGMRKLLKARSRPTAVFVANDFAALGALEVLDEAGIAVPQEMSIVGYDNVKEAGHRRIALTTVEQPLLSMGETALDLLLERLEEDRIDARHLVLPPRLVLRNSTGPPRRGR